MVSVYTRQEILKSVLPYTNWIGFNYFELIGSKYYSLANALGLRRAFCLDDDTKIFLATTAKDKQLIRFYDDPNWMKKFRSDVRSFAVDLTMGPDLFSYKDDPLTLRKKLVEKSIALTAECLDIQNLAPAIRGTNFEEMAYFINHFKTKGKDLFVFAGREYLINLADRKKAQQEAFTLTANLVRTLDIKMIMTGCSSPRLMEKLFAVWGFAGQGWLIQSNQRRLIKDKTYVSIFDKKFSCHDPHCCCNVTMEQLRNKQYDSVRAIHNLKQINASLKGLPNAPQVSMEEF
jgi:hypothetical protein